MQLLFNQRDDPSGLPYPSIDGLLHTAADAVTHWPDHDLFPEYVPCEGVYLPLVAREVPKVPGTSQVPGTSERVLKVLRPYYRMSCQPLEHQANHRCIDH